MPIHLLGKKSWNPYLPQNIARIKADEAEAAAREEELDKLKDEYDAEVREARLRGRSPPPLPERIKELEDPNYVKTRKRDSGSRDLGDRRKRRKLPGEDDTERDIRLARDAHEDAESARRRLSSSNAELTNKAGHIQLFAPERSERSNGVEKNAEAERERKKKERELEDQYTMRFSNAAGHRKKAKDAPWYAGDGAAHNEEKVGRNAFGDEDVDRHKRDEARMKSSDPMAAMKAAQKQLKEGKRTRELRENVDEHRQDRSRRDRPDREHRQKHRHRDRHRDRHRVHH